MSDVLQNEIKEANRAMVNVVRKEAPLETKLLSNETIINILSDDGYRGFLSGWLLSRGMFDPCMDCSKETNRNNN